MEQVTNKPEPVVTYHTSNGLSVKQCKALEQIIEDLNVKPVESCSAVIEELAASRTSEFFDHLGAYVMGVAAITDENERRLAALGLQQAAAILTRLTEYSSTLFDVSTLFGEYEEYLFARAKAMLPNVG